MPNVFSYEESRKLFTQPDVITEKADLEPLMKWNKPDELGLKEFLVGNKGFTEVKVDSGLKRLQASQQKVNQSRLDCFFKAAGTSKSVSTPQKKSD